MIGESLLGLLAVLATTAGMSSPAAWHQHYASWKTSAGLATKIDAFIGGAAPFLTTLGLPQALAASFIAIIVVSFALTTLDSATRLLRFNLEEMVRSLHLPRLFGHRWVSSISAVLVILGFATLKVGGKPVALALWTLFGTTNQLLAGLTLLVVSLYLKQRGKKVWFTLLPMLYMLGVTFVAMVHNLIGFLGPSSPTHSWLLAAVGGILLVLATWLVIEALLAWRRHDQVEGWEVPLELTTAVAPIEAGGLEPPP